MSGFESQNAQQRAGAGIIGSTSGMLKQPLTAARTEDLNNCISMLNSQQLKQQGLETLTPILSQVLPLLNQNVNGCVASLFRGLRSCLQSQDQQTDILMSVNQVLYDLMPDLNRLSQEMQSEISALIPLLIENLGNPKPNVRKSTHKCIGTFVKFSKRLDLVLTMIINNGLNSQNQRTRQHSMLVIPALISLKPSVVNEITPEMTGLVEEVLMRLRDPAEQVAKTAKKLILELHKNYPETFEKNYVATKTSDEEKQICRLIMANNFDEAQKLIAQSSPSKRMQIQQQSASLPIQQKTPQPQTSMGFSAIGKAIQQDQRLSNAQAPSQVLSQMNMSKEEVKSPTFVQKSYSLNTSNPQGLSVIGREIMANQGKTKIEEVKKQAKLEMKNEESKQLKEPQSATVISTSESASRDNVQRVISQQIPQTEPLMAILKNAAEKPPVQAPPFSQQSTQKEKPQSEPPVFGFVPKDVMQGLNDSNQWKDRTQSMETIQVLFESLLQDKERLSGFTGANATDFLGFIVKFVADINFKISITAIKIVQTLHERAIIDVAKHYSTVVSTLVEKLSDSKQSMRDVTMQCCASVVKASQPGIFAFAVVKELQHANWHVREAVLILIARCLLLEQGKEGAMLAVNGRLIEELCFLIKVEDKKSMQQMGVDCLALAMVTSSNRWKTESLITKELGIQHEAKPTKRSREDQLFEQIFARVDQGATPTLNQHDVVEFKPQQQPQHSPAPSANFIHHKQQAEIIQPPSVNEINSAHVTQQQHKTPSMQFIENKRKEEEKQQPQSAKLLEQTTSSFLPLTNQTTPHSSLPIKKPLDELSDSRKVPMRLPAQPLDSQSEKYGPAEDTLSADMGSEPRTFNRTGINQFIGSPLVHPKNARGQNPTINSSSAHNLTHGEGMALIQSAGPTAKKSAFQSSDGAATKNPFATNGFQTPSVSTLAQLQLHQQNSQENVAIEANFLPQPMQKPRSIQSGQINYATNLKKPERPNSNQNQSNGQLAQTSSSVSSMGAPARGFDKSQITDRLQILKNTNKYKQKVDGTTNPLQQEELSELGKIAISHMGKEDDEDSTFNKKTNNTTHPHSLYSEQRAIKAAHLKMPSEDRQQVGQKKLSAPANVQLKQQTQSSIKQPSTSQYSAFTELQRGSTKQEDGLRSSSIDNLHPNHMTQNIGAPARQVTQAFSASQSEKKPPLSRFEHVPSGITNSDVNYEIKEEPLPNPERQIREALDNLKSSDWSKQFDACNTIKRGVLFHKQTFDSGNISQLFKDIIKPVDSLRSQVSKNACMALSQAFCELHPKDTDPFIDSVLPVLLKRATDTNNFIQQEAEKTLISICNNCTETRVFASLQSQTLKSSAYKEVVCLCYTVLIERLGDKVKNFRDCERLVQTVAKFLSEGAVEVRNQAKLAILTLQSVTGSEREMQGLLLKCRLDEGSMEKVRMCLEKEDFESLSNYANTRYGGNMRGSPVGGARNIHYGGNPSEQRPVVGTGSDGFIHQTNKMQKTFMSGGAESESASAIGNQQLSVNIKWQPGSSQRNINNSAGFQSQSAFKQRATSVSKPVAKDTIEFFNGICDQCTSSAWEKRLQAIDNLQQFAETNSKTIKNATPSSFIKMVDAYCSLLQDNNLKVQTKTQQSLEALFQLTDLGALWNSNLTMVVSAITQNLSSTNGPVRIQGDRLLDLLEEVVMSESKGYVNNLMQPLVSQLAHNHNKTAKPVIVDRLCSMIERVDKASVLERYLVPLVQPTSKLASEATQSAQLKQALQKLQSELQDAGLK